MGSSRANFVPIQQRRARFAAPPGASPHYWRGDAFRSILTVRGHMTGAGPMRRKLTIFGSGLFLMAAMVVAPLSTGVASAAPDANSKACIDAQNRLAKDQANNANQKKIDHDNAEVAKKCGSGGG